MPFYDWLMSLSIMSSGFAHVVAGVRMSFLSKAEHTPVSMCPLVRQWTPGDLPLLVVASNAAVDMGKCLFETLFSGVLGINPEAALSALLGYFLLVGFTASTTL